MAKCWSCCTSKQTFLIPLVLLHLPALPSQLRTEPNCSPVPCSSAFSDADYGFYSGKAGLRVSLLEASGHFQARSQGCDPMGNECAAAPPGLLPKGWDSPVPMGWVPPWASWTQVLLWCPELHFGVRNDSMGPAGHCQCQACHRLWQPHWNQESAGAMDQRHLQVSEGISGHLNQPRSNPWGTHVDIYIYIYY